MCFVQCWLYTLWWSLESVWVMLLIACAVLRRCLKFLFWRAFRRVSLCGSGRPPTRSLRLICQWSDVASVNIAIGVMSLLCDGGFVSRMAVCGRCEQLASGQLMMFACGQVVRTLQGHTNGVSAVVVSPDGQFVYSGSADKTVKQWRSDTGEVSVCALCSVHVGCL